MPAIREDQRPASAPSISRRFPRPGSVGATTVQPSNGWRTPAVRRRAVRRGRTGLDGPTPGPTAGAGGASAAGGAGRGRRDAGALPRRRRLAGTGRAQRAGRAQPVRVPAGAAAPAAVADRRAGRGHRRRHRDHRDRRHQPGRLARRRRGGPGGYHAARRRRRRPPPRPRPPRRRPRRRRRRPAPRRRLPASVLSDGQSGLSYAQLATPWTPVCPSDLNSAFPWTAGESAVAGPDQRRADRLVRGGLLGPAPGPVQLLRACATWRTPPPTSRRRSRMRNPSRSPTRSRRC